MRAPDRTLLRVVEAAHRLRHHHASPRSSTLPIMGKHDSAKGGPKGGKGKKGKGGSGKIQIDNKSADSNSSTTSANYGWCCGVCQSQVSLNHEWCWQCGSHWNNSSAPAAAPPGADGGGAGGQSQGNPPKTGPVIQAVHQALVALEKRAGAEGGSPEHQQQCDQLRDMLVELRKDRDANNTPSQLAQASSHRLQKAQQAVERHKSNIENYQKAVTEAESILERKKILLNRRSRRFRKARTA